MINRLKKDLIDSAEPLVSVVICSYNSGNFIDRCIQSLLTQTYKNLEIVIVDCSSDDTFNKILAFEDSRIIPIHIESRVTPAEARNMAIERCSGEYIALMDSDDYCVPNRIESQLHHLLLTSSDVCSSYFYEVNTVSAKIRKSKQAFRDPDIRALMAIYNPVCNPSVLLRKSVLRRPAYRVDYPYSEDSEMWCELALRARFTCCRKYLLYYSVHGNQLSRQYEKHAVYWFHKARNDYLKQLLGTNWEPIRVNFIARTAHQLKMLSKLNSAIPGISWRVNCEIYSRLQFKGGLLHGVLMRLERYCVASYFVLRSHAIGLDIQSKNEDTGR